MDAKNTIDPIKMAFLRPSHSANTPAGSDPITEPKSTAPTTVESLASEKYDNALMYGSAEAMAPTSIP